MKLRRLLFASLTLAVLSPLGLLFTMQDAGPSADVIAGPTHPITDLDVG